MRRRIPGSAPRFAHGGIGRRWEACVWRRRSGWRPKERCNERDPDPSRPPAGGRRRAARHGGADHVGRRGPGCRRRRAVRGGRRACPRTPGRAAPTTPTASWPRSSRSAGCPTVSPAAVLRGLHRARIGTGVAGAGAALWVQATVVEETPVTDHTRELAASYKAVAVSILQHRGAWQFVDGIQRISDPSTLADTAGYAPYLDVDKKLWLLATANVDERLEKLRRVEPRPPRRARGLGDRSSTTCAKAWRRASASSCCASSWPRSARSSARTSRRAARTTGPGSRAPTCRRRSARPRCARSTSSSAAATRTRRPAGSAPGSTPSSSCRGTYARRTTPTSWPPAHVLDADHEGLDDVKDRIVEYLAVRARRAERGIEVGRRPRQWRGAGAGRSAGRRQDLARRVGGARTRAQRSSGSPSVAYGTRRRSAGTGGRMSARCPAAWSAPSARPAR